MVLAIILMFRPNLYKLNFFTYFRLVCLIFNEVSKNYRKHLLDPRTGLGLGFSSKRLGLGLTLPLKSHFSSQRCISSEGRTGRKRRSLVTALAR